MVHLDLNENETAVVRQMIERYLSDLRMEITDTDRQDYREMLKERKRVLERVLGELGPEQRSEAW